MKRFSVLLVLLLVTGASVAATIHVPANQPTIQAGINAAKNGDRVVVARGTYFENINFAGKAITVAASSGRTVTIIDGGHAGSVVTFDSGEGRDSVLEGFTVQNGNASLEGGGIYIFNASPAIKLNTVTNNVACGSGAGIAVEFSSALVQNNVISSNSESGCTGGLGGGLYVGGAGSALVTGNTIQKNSATFGGGMALFATTTPTLENNVIHGNVATDQTSQGGGLWIVDSSEALLVQNLIYNNTATQGAQAPMSQFLGIVRAQHSSTTPSWEQLHRYRVPHFTPAFLNKGCSTIT
ncbi:MAG TPA: right-handed parallel beta-helix repeat-containing protein [Candidatus Acidoferrum sp.]|nr:right-handed parallel beta-helix repeat-containing protein [Candidatus Acidoferrum sp.]